MSPLEMLNPILAGVCLAAVAGLRAFLPLFAVGLASRFGGLPLADSFHWLATTPALLVFGSATVIEVLADKVPVVDHVLDALGLVVKPVAGAVAAAAMTSRLDPLWTTVIALLVGGSIAGSVHVAKAKTRLGSSMVSLGHANPLLSIAEDAASVGGSLAAFLWPVVGALLLAVAALAAYVLWRIVRSGRRGPEGLQPAAPGSGARG